MTLSWISRRNGDSFEPPWVDLIRVLHHFTTWVVNQNHLYINRLAGKIPKNTTFTPVLRVLRVPIHDPFLDQPPQWGFI